MSETASTPVTTEVSKTFHPGTDKHIVATREYIKRQVEANYVYKPGDQLIATEEWTKKYLEE